MEPLVSVCCVTYNHEKYIAEAIESFLMQQTSFSIEIIIHDDASTDNTAQIIGEYERKYPEIIRPIYQKTNQYSQGKKPLRDFMMPLVKGEYIATCEGDDFWVVPDKLQKQVEFLENNQKYIMCFHKVEITDVNKKFLRCYLGLPNGVSKEINVAEAATGGVVHVSSRLVRSDFYKKPRPNWLDNARHGDYAIALYTAAEGKVFYINEVMSAYRTGVENSVMTNFRNNYSRENDIEYHSNRIETLGMADEYYNYKYHDEIEKANLTSQVITRLLKDDYSSLAKKYYKNYANQNGLLGFIKLFLKKKYPSAADFLIEMKDSIRIIK